MAGNYCRDDPEKKKKHTESKELAAHSIYNRLYQIEHDRRKCFINEGGKELVAHFDKPCQIWNDMRMT